MKKVVKLKLPKAKLRPCISVKNISMDNSKVNWNMNSGNLKKVVILNPNGTMMRNVNIPLTATNKKTDDINRHRSFSKSKQSLPSNDNCVIISKYEVDQAQRISTGNTTEKSESIKLLSSPTIPQSNPIKVNKFRSDINQTNNQLIIESSKRENIKEENNNGNLSNGKFEAKIENEQDLSEFLKSIGLEKVNQILYKYKDRKSVV